MSKYLILWGYYLPIFGSLLWAAVRDVKTHKIPNKYTAALAVYSLLSIPVRSIAQPRLWDAVSLPNLAADALLGGLLGGGLLLLVSVLTKGGFGGGDVKLMTGLGLAFGVFGAMSILFLAVILTVFVGLIQRKYGKKGRLPFAPFLFLGCVFTAYFLGLF